MYYFRNLLATEGAAASKNVVPKRSETQKDLTWDLKDLFADDAAWEKAFEEVQPLVQKLAAYQGRVGESADVLLEIEKENEKAGLILMPLYTYASMKNDEDTGESKYNGMTARMGQFMARFMAAVAWYEPEIAALDDETLNRFYKEEPELELYRYHFDTIRRSREHMLSPREESLLARGSEVMGAAADIFSVLDNADQRFPVIKDEQGEDIELTHGRYGKLMESRSRRVREDAFRGLYSTYRQYRNTYAATLSANVKKHNYLAEVRGFSSARAAALFNNHIPESVYDQLLETVHGRLDLLHRYVALRKKMLGLDDMHCFDLYVPVVEEVDLEYTIEEARDILMKALAVLGEDYLKILDEAFRSRWIDFVENQGKRSGAYSGGCYNSPPYILMTWKGTLDNLYTLAHELGHSCHSYFTRHFQPYIYGDYSIFLAEIASTTNENLLTAYLLDTVSDPAIRRYILMHYLDGFKGTVFRQTQFADFEHLIHKADQEGIALTADWLAAEYGKMNARYYGEVLNADEEIALEWARIPHFYYNYYVYQYATGFSAATAFSSMILKGGEKEVEAYKGYLKAGSSADPIDVLKKAGLDMSSPKPISDALDRFEYYLTELEKLES